MRYARSVSWLFAAAAGFLSAALSPAQTVSNTNHGIFRAGASIVIPQTRSFSAVSTAAIEIREITADVVIVEQAATTTMDIELSNAGGARQEAELLVPVPDGVVVRGFTFQGAADEPTAELLPAAEAKRIYDGLVATIRDPALLEFAGYNMVRSSVFPVEAGGTQKVRLTYEHLLTAEGDRVDYVLPRSESLDYKTPWNVSVKITSKQPISTTYSPSHPIETKRTGPGAVSVRVRENARTEPGAFRLSYLRQRGGVTASLMAYPDAKLDGGYFLLLAGLPPRADDKQVQAQRREVTLVLDRSGSMAGEKIEQAREAALQVLTGLNPGEYFNIIAYNDAVDALSSKPVKNTKKNREEARKYLAAITAQGGTNIHAALTHALAQPPADETLPLVLFLTDGLPTVGETSESAIRDVVTKSNPRNRRVFTFGVGMDVNTPLLQNLATDSRARASFVLPKEDVEVKVGQVFKGLKGPVLTSPVLSVVPGPNDPVRARAWDMLPRELNDLFEDDQIIVLGKYRGDDSMRFELRGRRGDQNIKYGFKLDVDKATTRHAFVPRLWASRRIGFLSDAIRDLGASPAALTGGPDTIADPRLKELVGEIVRLGTEFGILTEYTAFLAREGTNLSDDNAVLTEASGNFRRQAWGTRSGVGSVQQELNNSAQMEQSCSNYGNGMITANFDNVAFSQIRQICDNAFFRRAGRWVDSRLVEKGDELKPARTIEFGSDEFKALLGRLVREGRQGTISLPGDIMLMIDDKPVLVKTPTVIPTTDGC